MSAQFKSFYTKKLHYRVHSHKSCQFIDFYHIIKEITFVLISEQIGLYALIILFLTAKQEIGVRKIRF